MVSLDLPQAFGASTIEAVQLPELSRRLEQWSLQGPRIHEWTSYTAQCSELEKLSLGPLVDRLNDGRITPEQAVDSFRMAYFEELLRDVFHRDPELGRFDGEKHQQDSSFA